LNSLLRFERFEPLISEELFFRVQAILSGRLTRTAPRQRAHPDFPRAASFAANPAGEV